MGDNPGFFLWSVIYNNKRESNRMEKENNPITFIKRMRFKPLPFNKETAYKRLTEKMEYTEKVFLIEKNLRKWKYFSAAVFIALLIVSAFYAGFIRSVSNQQSLYVEVTAVPDATTKIILPDSSQVCLNANACIRYPKEFKGDIRKVEISGEAFFNVQKDNKKPFIVQLDGMYVKVLGTSFNIDAKKESDKIKITLLKGKIALFDNAGSSGISGKILTPDQQAIYHKAQNSIYISTVRPETYVSWMTGIFQFQENTLDEIMEELQRAFHVKIHIENEEMGKKTFNAEFKNKETLDEILSILQISARYTIEKKRGEIYIR